MQLEPSHPQSRNRGLTTATLIQWFVQKPPMLSLMLWFLQVSSLLRIQRCWWLSRNLLWFPLVRKPFLKRLSP